MPDLSDYTLFMFSEHAAGPVLFDPQFSDAIDELESRLRQLATERWPELADKPNCIVGDAIERHLVNRGVPKRKARQLPVAEVIERLEAEPGGGQAVDGDSPNERGYVESPADPAAYVSASEVLAKHTPADLLITEKRLAVIVEDYTTNRVRWTRPISKAGRPILNRRSVHLGDWVAYLKRLTAADADGFPRMAEDEFESRKAAVRNTRHARK